MGAMSVFGTVKNGEIIPMAEADAQTADGGEA